MPPAVLDRLVDAAIRGLSQTGRGVPLALGIATVTPACKGEYSNCAAECQHPYCPGDPDGAVGGYGGTGGRVSSGGSSSTGGATGGTTSTGGTTTDASVGSGTDGTAPSDAAVPDGDASDGNG